MSRSSRQKPWLHQASGYFCTSVNRRRVYLDKDYQLACRKLRELRAEQQRGAAARDWLDAPFADLADEFLDDLKARRRPTTHESYRHRLLRALKVLGTHIRVGQLRKLHLAKIEQHMSDNYSPTTIKDTIAAVQAVFSWAVRLDVLAENPLAGYVKPRARMRTRVIEPAEFRALLRHSDPAFRRLLVAIRFTGCRPVEIRNLRWEWVDLEQGVWILPDHKTITTQQHPKPRVIPLPDSVWKMCRLIARRGYQPGDRVFLNAHDKPYSKDCLCRKLARVRLRSGVGPKAGERLVLYSARHTYATETSGAISDIELAELLGQTDTRTTRRYVHFNVARLREIQRRAQAGRMRVPENA
jgi:integrase